MKKIMIIGATGSCGSYTAIGLKSKGYNVVAVAHRPSDNGFFEEKGIPYFSIDIRKRKHLPSCQQILTWSCISLV